MHEVKSIQDLLNQIGRDEILLPEFQRGYVWNRDQVRGLMQSFYNAVANRAILGQRAPKEYQGMSPAEYLPEVDEHQPSALRAQSVPMDRALWQPERFLDFLAARRRLLAEAMNEFIAGWLPEKEADPEQHVRALIAAGESETLEFKSSLRWDRREDCVNKALEGVVVKTLAGFLNAAGGTLLIGVDDGGALVGLAADYATLKKQDRDGFELHLQNILARDLGEAASSSFLDRELPRARRAGHLPGHGGAERPRDIRGAQERSNPLPARRQSDPAASRQGGCPVRRAPLGEDDVIRDADHDRRRRGGVALDARTLHEIIRRVVEVAQPERIILFGSAARGEMGPHSDVDLLVIKEVVDRRGLSTRIHRSLYGVEAAVDVVVVTPADVQRYKDAHALIIKPALREGRVVYEAG